MDQGRTKKLLNLGMVDPKHWAKQLWDLLVFILAVYTSIEVPFRVAFGGTVEAKGAGPQFVMDIIIDFAFSLDFFLGFITAKEDLESGTIIYEKNIILKKYLRATLFPDFLACVPMLFIKPGEVQRPKSSLIDLILMTRLFKCFKAKTFVNEI